MRIIIHRGGTQYDIHYMQGAFGFVIQASWACLLFVVLQDDVPSVRQIIKDEEAMSVQAGVRVLVGMNALSNAACSDQAPGRAAAAYCTQKPESGFRV